MSRDDRDDRREIRRDDRDDRREIRRDDRDDRRGVSRRDERGGDRKEIRRDDEIPRRDERGGSRRDDRDRRDEPPMRRDERGRSSILRDDGAPSAVRIRRGELPPRKESSENPPLLGDSKKNISRRSQEAPVPPNKPAAKVPEHPGSATVWIGSIPDGASDDDLFDAVAALGDVEGMRMVPQRGFGYVRFKDADQAKNVVSNATNVFVAGKRVRVDPCEHMPQLSHPYKPAAGKPPLCETLFVGNLPPETSEDEVGNFFKSQVPQVEVVSVSMRRGGGYRGLAFAHVKFDSGESCQAAMAVAGARLRNSRLRLDWAVDKATATHASDKLTSELRGLTPRLYVGGLNESIEEEEVRAAFAPFGEVIFVRLHRDKFGVRSFGYVTFASAEAAASAIDNLGQLMIKGAKVRADFARQDRMQQAANAIDEQHAPQHRARSPSPLHQRITPITTEVPQGYGAMKTWDECYGKTILGSANGVATH